MQTLFVITPDHILTGIGLVCILGYGAYLKIKDWMDK